MTRPLRLAALLALAATPAAAQAYTSGFHVEVTPDRTEITVGDVVTYRARLHLGLQPTLVSPVPEPLGELPEGVRLVAADSIRKGADAAWEGTFRVAYLRPGPSEGFTLALRLKRIGADRGSPVSISVPPLEVASVIPPGTPPVREIRDIVRDPVWPWVLVPACGALAVLALVARRRGWTLARRRPAPAAPVAVGPGSPYDEALRALARIEQDELARRGDVAEHYAAVYDVLRDYLHAAGHLGRPRLARGELLDAVPAALRRTALAPTLDDVAIEADLVKFAALRPDLPRATGYLEAARALLAAWRAEAHPREAAGAVR